MKYFFLSDRWITGRVWEFGGLWNEQARRRKPLLQKQSLCIQENDETLYLYQAEDAVLMVEVMPEQAANSIIGQVVLKRLLTADQVIERLCQEDSFYAQSHAARLGESSALPQTANVTEAVGSEYSQP